MCALSLCSRRAPSFPAVAPLACAGSREDQPGPVRRSDPRRRAPPAGKRDAVDLACRRARLQAAPPGVEHDEVSVTPCPARTWRRERLSCSVPPRAGMCPHCGCGSTSASPVAAGLGGGSADAAATLRLATAASGLGDLDLLFVLAAELGADVPAQVTPGRWLATGAGEQLQPLPDPVSPLGVLVLAHSSGLSTAEVYAEADRIGIARDASNIEERREMLVKAFELGSALPAETSLLHNDLQASAVKLCPAIENDASGGP